MPPDKVPPTLSAAERDRRWSRTRSMLADLKLDVLIVAGLKGRERYDGYLSNESEAGIVVFPAEGEPVFVTWGTHRFTRRLTPAARNLEFWINNLRAGPLGATVVEALRAMGASRSRIGVVGLETSGPLETDGIIPYRTWKHITDEVAAAEFVEASGEFIAMMQAKSEEELAVLRHSAAIGEDACRAMLAATAVGVPESDIYGAIMGVIYGNGAVPLAPELSL